jgi:methyl-accepting chemotaxis protein/methyl-accepting chemotaxis protein-1 (serine sensor receptor)
VAVVATLAGGYSLLTIHGIQNQMRAEIVGSSAKLDQSRLIATGIADMRSSMRGISLFSMMHVPGPFAKARSTFDIRAAEMRKTVQQMQASGLTPEEQVAVNSIESALDPWVDSFREFADMSAAGQGEEASAITLKKTSPLMDAIQKNAAEFGRMNSVRRDAAIAAVETSIQRNELVMLALTALVLLAGCGGFFAVTRMATTLKEIAESVGGGASQLAQAAAQVASSSMAFSQSSSENAAALEETSASVEEISSMAQRNTENSGRAAGLVSHSVTQFAETNVALDQMVGAMDEINASSKKISKIIKVIDEIAFQTNILALNAAVEAARAGESGMGFAVVADEVRNLAQRSAKAAQDTASLIEESMSKSESGKSRVDTVAKAIRAVTGEAAQVKTLVDEVSVGSREQATGLGQIGRAVTQMERAGQTTAATAEEGAAAAEQLTAQAATLTGIGEQLRGLVGGSRQTRALVH